MEGNNESSSKQGAEEGVGISNRGLEQERPAQDYVMDSVEGLEISGQRPDQSIGDRLRGKGMDIGDNLDPYVDSDTMLTPDEESGGERHIDSKGGAPDHSHH